MDDAVISDRLANRDQSALSELKSKYGKLIACVCRSVLNSPQEKILLFFFAFLSTKKRLQQ